MSGVKRGKTWRLHQMVTYRYRRSAVPHCTPTSTAIPTAACMTRPSMSLYALPISPANGCVSCTRRSPTALLSMYKRWRTSIISMRTTKAMTKPSTVFFPRRPPATDICESRQCGGILCEKDSNARIAGIYRK